MIMTMSIQGHDPTESPMLLTEPTDLPPAKPSALIKQGVFTVGFCGLCYCGAVVWQYENLRKQAKEGWKKHRQLVQDQMRVFK